MQAALFSTQRTKHIMVSNRSNLNYRFSQYKLVLLPLIVILLGLFVSSQPSQAAPLGVVTTTPFSIDVISKIIASDIEKQDWFGYSIALNGDTLAIGAEKDDDIGYDTGAVYVYTRSGNTWSLQQKLTASDGATGFGFGTSVALSGDTLAVGMPYSSTGFGGAYIFTRSAGVWTEQVKIVPSDTTNGDYFGYDVALSNNTLVVGAFYASNGVYQTGAAYIYTNSGATWGSEQKLLASDAEEYMMFGRSVAIAGDRIAVGAIRASDPSGNAGAVYVFANSAGTWAEQQKLQETSGGNAYFGNSVALDQATKSLVVGAPNSNSGSISQLGAAYVYVEDSSSTWTLQQALLASGGENKDHFGYDVSISGDTVVIGARDRDIVVSYNTYEDQGAVYIFKRTGTSWSQSNMLTALDGEAKDIFGFSVAVSGDTVAVGAPQGEINSPKDLSSAYIILLNQAQYRLWLDVNGDGVADASENNYSGEYDVRAYLSGSNRLQGRASVANERLLIPSSPLDVEIRVPFAARWVAPALNGRAAVDVRSNTTYDFGIVPLYDANHIAGVVYEDYDEDGSFDFANWQSTTFEPEPGTAGIRVTAYDNSGAAVATDNTDSSGMYQLDLSASSANLFRLEFTNLPAGFQPSVNGNHNSTSVVFASKNTNVNFGVYKPSLYRDGAFLVVNRTDNAANELLRFEYQANRYNSTPANSMPLALQATIGNTYGLAWQQSSETLFASAFFRSRSNVYGPGGSGGIYKLDDAYNATSSGGAVFVDLGTLAISTGPTTISDPCVISGSANTAANGCFHDVGYRGLGDLDISVDQETLYVINLYDHSLVSLAIGIPPSVPGAATVTNIPVPSNCNAADFIPFGLGVAEDGKVYVSATCNARSTQSIADLRGYIFEWDPSGAFPATPFLDFSLDYSRTSIMSPTNWQPWPATSNSYPKQRTPLLTNIGFDRGDLVLSVADLLGLVTINSVGETSGGDILRVCKSGASWALENAGSCGSYPAHQYGAVNHEGLGDGEYYWNDDGGEDDYLGAGVASAHGYRETIVTGIDIRTHGNWQGVAYIDNQTGLTNRKVSDLFAGTSDPGKSFNLGDVELIGKPATTQVGSRIWNDTNGNGIQDPNEPGIAGVTVALYDNNVKIGEAITGPDGEYYFGGINNINMLSSGSMRTITNNILLNSDDAYEIVGTGDMKLNDSDLYLPYDWDNQKLLTGLRFANISVPQGALVTNAYIQFVSNGSDSTPVNLSVQAIAEDNPSTFSLTNADISSRSLAAGAIPWSVPSWAYDDAGVNQQTPNLSSLVQALVNRPGWAAGNSMGFVIADNGTASNNDRRSAGTFFESERAAKLVVTYETSYTLPNSTALEIRIPNASGGSQQASLTGMKLTTANAPQPANAGAAATSNDQILDVADSDGAMLNDNAMIAFTTGAPGENNHGLDFGFSWPLTSALGNYVWVDENSDGYQDEGEPGIPNVTVKATWAGADATFGNADDLVLSTITNSVGGYLFSHLPAGQYRVQVDSNTIPNGMTQTTTYPSAGNDEYNQDQSGSGYTISLAVNATNLTADFGYNYNPTDIVNPPGVVPPPGGSLATLGNRVWIDVDGDGVQDSNEIGVSGVVVTLYNDPDNDGIYDNIFSTDTTDTNGNYLFDELPAGSYVVKVTESITASHDVLATYTQTGDPDHFGAAIPTSDPLSLASDHASTLPIILAPGDVFLNADFGYMPDKSELLGMIGDYVWFDANADGVQDADESPIRNVSVALIKDSNGNGVWDAGELIIATALTDASGKYLFNALPVTDGSGTDDYLVWVNDTQNALNGLMQTYDADGIGTPSAPVSYVLGLSSVANLDTTPILTQDFGYTLDNSEQHGPTGGGMGSNPGSIGDTIWLDSNGNGLQDNNESGIPGVLVQLQLPDNSTLTATTGPDGRYLFANLLADTNGETYIIEVLPSNFTPGGALEGMNITADPYGLLDNISTTKLTDLATIDLLQDFGYAGKGEIGNLIWDDINANGKYEPKGIDGVAGTADDELPISGVTVELYKDINGNGMLDAGEPLVSSTVTDSTLSPDNGNYLLSGLGYGNYIVDVTDQAGVLAGYWHSLGTAATNEHSQADPYGVNITSANPKNLTADFGYYKLGSSIGNRVWFDTDADGQQDAGEKGVNGLKVTLTIDYQNGDKTMLNMLTRNDPVTGEPGWYNFSNLLMDENHSGIGSADATYTVSVALAGLTITKTDAVADDMMDSDNALGVVAQPVKGHTSLTAINPSVTSSEEKPIASYDFGLIAADWGDLPNGYKTNLTSNGPRHIIAPSFNADGTLNLAAMSPTFWMGNVIPDITEDGNPTVSASGDGADEDGVRANIADWDTDSQNGGQPGGKVEITVSGTGGYVVGWFDFDNNSIFDSVIKQQLPSGVHQIAVSVPNGTFYPDGSTGGISQTVYARFRIFANQSEAELAMSGAPTITSGFDGIAAGGEVEDYVWGFDPTAVTITSMDANVSSNILPILFGLAVIGITTLILLGWQLQHTRAKR